MKIGENWWKLVKIGENGENCEKGAVRVSFPPFSWGKQSPPIGQAPHGRMAGIVLLIAWPIRGDCVPQETGGKLTLTAPFKKSCFFCLYIPWSNKIWVAIIRFFIFPFFITHPTGHYHQPAWPVSSTCLSSFINLSGQFHQPAWPFSPTCLASFINLPGQFQHPRTMGIKFQ